MGKKETHKTKQPTLKTKQILLHGGKSHMEIMTVRSHENTHSAYLLPCVRGAGLLLALVDHHLERMWMLLVRSSSRDVS